MKRIAAAVLAIVICLSLAACAGAKPASSAPAAVSDKLIVGLDDQFPPMGFRDKNNNIVGFDVELAQTVGKRLGMEVVLTPIDWTTKELELNGDKVNVLWNGLTITDERKEAMLMSPAYIANAQVVVVNNASGISKLADLAGKTVALQESSSAEDAWAGCEMSGKEKELIKAADNITLFTDLKIGRIDAVVIDKVFAEYYIVENGEGKLSLLTDELDDEEYGVAFKKGNTALAEKVLKEFNKMVEDGTAAEISKKWFGDDRIIFKY